MPPLRYADAAYADKIFDYIMLPPTLYAAIDALFQDDDITRHYYTISPPR